MFKHIKPQVSALAALLFLGSVVQAGFLEMPDTSEVPEYERESMLKDLNIPSVRERDPDPEAGPRLNVTEFRIQGIVEFPELGITREALIQQVEELRFDLMAEGEMLDSGYTLDELGEVSDMISDIEKETEGEHVGPVDVQRLVFLIRDQRRKRGVTLGMIETVADTITRYYRERGFILAKAYIPKQRVRDGVVTLTVLLGELGEVDVVNNKKYKKKTIQKVFKDLMGKPVTAKKIEEKLYLVNDLPGFTGQGYFQPGSQVGDTKLTVNTLNERWFDANIRLDNHGSESAGENRVYADLLVNSLLGGDSLHLEALTAIDQTSTTFGSIRYTTKFFHPKIEFSVSTSTNDFIIDENSLLNEDTDSSSTSSLELDIEGSSQTRNASFRLISTRSRIKNTSFSLEYSKISSQLESNGSPIVDDQVSNISLRYNFDFLNERRRFLHVGTAFLTYSSLDNSLDVSSSGGDERRDTSATILGYDYSLLTFVNSPFSDKDTRVVIRSSGQYAGVSMSSINQFGLAGPTKARGFDVNKSFNDDAIYLGADWLFNGPSFMGKFIEKTVQPLLFIDASYGLTHSNVSQGKEKTENQLANLGLGFKFNYKGKIRGNMLFGFPVLSETSSKGQVISGSEGGGGDTRGASSEDDKSTVIYFDLQYSF